MNHIGRFTVYELVNGTREELEFFDNEMDALRYARKIERSGTRVHVSESF